jgi:hypothetical protein
MLSAIVRIPNRYPNSNWVYTQKILGIPKTNFGYTQRKFGYELGICPASPLDLGIGVFMNFKGPWMRPLCRTEREVK